MMKKRLGFTLSEVLIAMTVIGVISSLMVPRVLGNATKKQFTTQFKTTVSLIDSAAKEFKVEEGGFDFSGNRAHTRGDKNVSDILRDKLGAQLVQSGEYEVHGYSYMYRNSATSEGEPIACNLVTSSVTGGDYTKPDQVLAIPFGSTEQTTNPCFQEEVGTIDPNTPSPKGGSQMNCSTYPKSFTVKLNNGAFVFIPRNPAGCSYNNVRWDATNHTYITPDPYNAGNENTNLCLAYIDVNGPKGPNRLATCSGSNRLVYPGSTEICEMSQNNITDVYPVFFFDDSVYPATNAANTVWQDRFSD